MPAKAIEFGGMAGLIPNSRAFDQRVSITVAADIAVL
jgi:hypothetical protein